MMREMMLHPLQFTSDHRFTRSHASDFIDGDLDATQQARVETHAHLCPPCARFLATLRRTVAALGDLGKAPPEASPVAGGVIARLRTDADDRPDP